jgi:hypothetical protein
MPTQAEGLKPESGDVEVKQGISGCIAQMNQEHPDWSNERCIAACYSMAEIATGKKVKSKSTTVRGTREAAPPMMGNAAPPI